jgi:ubiquinone/menaquinone biosynthesis C-methylase UbiE
MSVETFHATMSKQGLKDNRLDEATAFAEEISLLGENLDLLEVGSGLGDMSVHLSSIPNIKSYRGIDSNRGFIDDAQRRFPRLNFTHGNFFEMPESEKFDVVCVPFTLTNLFQFPLQEKFLKKLIKHGGTVIVDTILPDFFGVCEDTIKHASEDEFADGYSVDAYYFSEIS